MKSHRHSATGSWLVLVLICAVVPQPAVADDFANEKPIRLYATETLGPIGTLYSPGSFSVDGRPACGEQAIWGGELIEAPAASSVSVRLSSVGRILLRSSTAARIDSKLTSIDGDTRHILVACLVSGDMAVKLEKDAGAYIESRGTTFVATTGADFVIRTREGYPAIDIASGRVDTEPQPPALTFTGRSVQVVNGLPRPIAGSDAIDTNTKKKKRVAIQFTKSNRTTGSLMKAFSPQLVAFRGQTPSIETPAVNRKVQVESTIGKIVLIDPVTNANGVVEADFDAGPNEGAGVIKARILPDPGDPPNTEYREYTRNVMVRKQTFLRTRNKVLLGAAAAAIVIIVTPKGKDSIKQEPPPTIQQ